MKSFAFRVSSFVILLCCVSIAIQAQSNTCNNGDALVVNSGGSKNNQCIPLNQQPAGTGSTMIVANAGSTGTTVNRLAKLTGAPSTAVITATSDTENAIGIVTAGAGTTGNATITILGQATCDFDNATVAGDYFIISAITAGQCHDAGNSYPTSGATYGRVLTTNGGAGSYVVELMTPDIAFQNAGNGKSKPGGSNGDVQVNGVGSTFAGVSPGTSGNVLTSTGSAWASTAPAAANIAPLVIESANLVAQRNGVNAQAACMYGTFTSATNYERVCTRFQSNVFEVAVEKGSGGGTQRNLRLSAVNSGGFNTTTVEINNAAIFPPNSDMALGGGGGGLWNAVNILQSAKMVWSSEIRIGAGGSGSSLKVYDSGNNDQGTIALGSGNYSAASGTTNNPDFGNGAYYYRVTPNAAGSTLTGGRDIPGSVNGEQHAIYNVGAAKLTLASNNASSSAGRRWITNTGMDIHLGPDEIAPYLYDSTTANLRISKAETSDDTYNTGDATNATTTMANLSDLSRTVTNTYNYAFDTYIYAADSTAVDGAKFDLDGGSATVSAFRCHCTLFDTALLLSAQTTALATDFAQATMTGDSLFECHGAFTASSTGTFIPRYAQNSHSAGTLTVYKLSRLDIKRIP